MSYSCGLRVNSYIIREPRGVAVEADDRPLLPRLCHGNGECLGLVRLLLPLCPGQLAQGAPPPPPLLPTPGPGLSPASAGVDVASGPEQVSEGRHHVVDHDGSHGGAGKHHKLKG